jgi:hypothetical protein
MDKHNVKIFIKQSSVSRKKNLNNDVKDISTYQKTLWSNSIKPKKDVKHLDRLTVVGYIFNMPEENIFLLSQKIDKITFYLTVIACIGAIVCCLIMYDIIDAKYSWIALLNYPVIIPRYLFANIYLFKELCKYFETWFLLINVVLIWWSICDIYQWNYVTIILTVYSSMWIQYIFLDALLISSRKRIFIMGIQLLYILSTILVLIVQEERFTFRDISIFYYFKYNTKSIFTDRMFMLLFFDLRHLYQAITDKNAFIILKSNLIMFDPLNNSRIQTQKQTTQTTQTTQTQKNISFNNIKENHIEIEVQSSPISLKIISS